MMVPDTGCVDAPSFRDGPKDQTSDVQLHIGESRDSGFDAFASSRNDGGSRHFLLQDFGEAVEAVFGGNLAKDRLLDQRHAIGVDLAAPAGISEIRTDDADV